MDEAVLEALAAAAMLPSDKADELSGDLSKIEIMTSRAASTKLAEGEIGENPTMARFANKMGTSGEDKTPLREDEAVKYADRDIISQSKRYEGTYTSVPRIV